MKNQLTLLLGFLIFPFCLSAQDFDKEKMDQLFDLLEESDRAMLTVSLFDNGEEIYTRSIGYADIEREVKATSGTQYRMGSITKTYLATLILQLVEQGKLSLQTPLADLFPDVPNAEDITIKMLLNHRSGIFNFTSADDYLSYHEQPKSREQLLELISSFEPVFEPGSRLEYSNSNYVLLTMILEQLTGSDFNKLIFDNISQAHGLGSTFVANKLTQNIRHANSYERKQEWELSTETHSSVPLGAGSLSATAFELNRFFYLLFSHQVISEASLETMTTATDGFGLGVFQIPFFNKRAWGHTGGIDGFHSTAAFFPEDGLGVVLLSNASATDLNNILIGMLSIYYNMPYEMPEFPPFLFLEEEELMVYEGTYSHPQFPLKISIWNEGNSLMAQATDQPSFTLDARGDHLFAYDAARLTLTFNPEKETMLLQQAGMEWLMTKEEVEE